MTSRSLAVQVFVVLLICLGATLWLATPPPPLLFGAGNPHAIADPMIDFSAAEVTAGNELGHRLRWVSYGRLFVGLAVVIALGFWPLGARIAAAVARPFGGKWWLEVLLGGLVILLTARVATLPFSAWGKSILQDAGLSTGSWSSWRIDLVKGFGITTAFTLFVVFLLVGLARRLPRWWWMIGAVGAALLVAAVNFVYPVVVEPTFNKFTPLVAGQLRTSLLDLAQRDGVTIAEVLVSDASRSTSSLNAYVSGFGATRRIVLYDTLLSKAGPDEILSTMAHELGHVKENDPLIGTFLSALANTTGIVALFLTMSWLPLLRQAGVSGMADGRVVALYLAFFKVTTLLIAPVECWHSRRIEARADVNALELTRDPTTFIRKHRLLALTSKSDLTPAPIYHAWFGSHPATAERIALAREWARQNEVAAPPPLSPDRSTGQ